MHIDSFPFLVSTLISGLHIGTIGGLLGTQPIAIRHAIVLSRLMVLVQFVGAVAVSGS